jgi:hypothetical protein
MSYDEGGDYEEYSDEVARKAGRAQRKAESMAGDIANERPVTTSTGKVIAPPRPGHGDSVTAILEMVLFLVILGLSAACLKQIKDGRDAGNTATCFLAADATWRVMIGILVVSTVGFVHALIVMIFGMAKRLPGLRYALMLCLIPYTIVLVVLSSIIIGWGHPSPSSYAGAPLANPDEACAEYEPYKLVRVTAAVTLAFSGWLLLFIPVMALFACYNDIVNNPKLVQAREVLMEEGRAAARKANRGRSAGEPAAEHAVKKGRAKARKAAREADSELSSALDEEES